MANSKVQILLHDYLCFTNIFYEMLMYTNVGEHFWRLGKNRKSKSNLEFITPIVFYNHTYILKYNIYNVKVNKYSFSLHNTNIHDNWLTYQHCSIFNFTMIAGIKWNTWDKTRHTMFVFLSKNIQMYAVNW